MREREKAPASAEVFRCCTTSTNTKFTWANKHQEESVMHILDLAERSSSLVYLPGHMLMINQGFERTLLPPLPLLACI